MCRRFALDLDWDAVASQFAVDEDDVRVDTLPQPSCNIAPTQNIGVVAQGKDGRRHLPVPIGRWCRDGAPAKC